MSNPNFTFLALENLHVFITGAAGGIGSQAVTEFLNQGCKVTAHDLLPIPTTTTLTPNPSPSPNPNPNPNLYIVQGDISIEASVQACFASAKRHFGPINILIANAGITDESHEYPIWQMPVGLWQRTYDVNNKGTFLTIKHFLQSADRSQHELGHELENLAIVGHTEYASGKAGLQYGLVRGVKNEIVRLNQKARINAVAPGWVDTPLIEGRLDDPEEMWAEAQATVPLRKIAQPHDVACTMAFLASHRAAGHISGECISVDGGMEGRIIWKKPVVIESAVKEPEVLSPPTKVSASLSLPQSLPKGRLRQIKVALSVDFDAVSGWLGTGAHPDNNMADYSAGFFSGKVGAPRLVRLFKKLGLADRMTWFIPGHTMETFPEEVKQIVDSGSEVALHGYSHEGAPQLNDEQQKDVVLKCIDLATKLTGKRPVGWRAPLYQIRESTYSLLEEQGFAYDTSLCGHDSEPYFAPRNHPISPINFSQAASTWMHPSETSRHSQRLVEIPCNWYMEDATPLQFYPHTANSHGYADIRGIEQMWKDRFTWLWENERERSDPSQSSFLVFPLVLHPDTSGMPHIIQGIERILLWLKGWGEGVVFERYEDIAKTFLSEKQETNR